MPHTCLFGSISSDPTLDPFALPLATEPLRRWIQQHPASRHALGVGGIQHGRPVVRSRGGVEGLPPDPIPHLLDTPGRARLGTLILDAPRVPPEQLPPYRAGGWVFAPWMLEDTGSSGDGRPQSGTQDRPWPRHRPLSHDEARFLPLISALERVDSRSGRTQHLLALVDGLRDALSELAAGSDAGSVDPALDLVATNGDVLIACADRAPVSWLRRVGVSREELRKADPFALGLSRDRPDYCVQIVAQGMGAPSGWEILPPGSLLVLPRDAEPISGVWRG